MGEVDFLAWEDCCAVVAGDTVSWTDWLVADDSSFLR